MFEISINQCMCRIEFEGTLDEAKRKAEEIIAYNQQDIVIYKDGEEVTRRRWYGVEPNEDDENVIEIGNGFYADWTEN